MIPRVIPSIVTANFCWQLTISELFTEPNCHLLLHVLEFILICRYTYWSLWKRVRERSTWRWHGHGHRHWHRSIRSPNWCCEPTPASSSRAPFLHIICESNINKIRLYSRRSFCLRERTQTIRPCHRPGSLGSRHWEISGFLALRPAGKGRKWGCHAVTTKASAESPRELWS